MNTNTLRLTHIFSPVYDTDSQILILGSFPSVKSRETNFYYGHPRNRFWPLLAHLMQEPCPESTNDKKAFLLKHHIALWDVVQSCEIHGSSDASIRNVIPADIQQILHQANIQAIYANGTTAYKLYQKYCFPKTNREIFKLPSTSPANAAWNMEKLIAAWQVIVP